MASPSAAPRSEDSSTATSLIRQLQADDADAWNRLIELYGPLVFHWMKQAELSPEDRADVFQEVFRAVARSINSFSHRHHEGGTFRGWLLVITKNKLRDHQRKLSEKGQGGTQAYQRLMSLEDPDEDVTTDGSGANPISSLLRRALHSIRADTNDQTWKAFWRTTVDGLSSSATAEELGMTPGAVRKAKARVLARLRLELGDQ